MRFMKRVLTALGLGALAYANASAEPIILLNSARNLDYAAVICSRFLAMEPSAADTVSDANREGTEQADWIREILDCVPYGCPWLASAFATQWKLQFCGINVSSNRRKGSRWIREATTNDKGTIPELRHAVICRTQDFVCDLEAEMSRHHDDEFVFFRTEQLRNILHHKNFRLRAFHDSEEFFPVILSVVHVAFFVKKAEPLAWWASNYQVGRRYRKIGLPK